MLNFATFDFEAVWWIALPSCKIFSCLANNRRVELASWVDGRTPAGKWCAMQNTSMLHPPRYSFPPSAFRALAKQSIRGKISKIISFSSFIPFVRSLRIMTRKLNKRKDFSRISDILSFHQWNNQENDLEERFRKSLASLVSSSSFLWITIRASNRDQDQFCEHW